MYIKHTLRELGVSSLKQRWTGGDVGGRDPASSGVSWEYSSESRFFVLQFCAPTCGLQATRVQTPSHPSSIHEKGPAKRARWRQVMQGGWLDFGLWMQLNII